MKRIDWERIGLILLPLMLASVSICSAGSIKAFSLREANRQLMDGTSATEELRTLSGITRFVGMVFDREKGDVILVGKIRDDLPTATIDDLAVALRCRLQAGVYPCVSIDMGEQTAKTGMQDVRFVGGIERTQFGGDFLQSDVLLKQYSLDLLNAVSGVDSYLRLYEKATRTRLEQEGHPVDQIKWYSERESEQALKKYEGAKATPGGTVQSRFWFHVRDDASFIVEQDDVYVIEELRLGVRAETLTDTQAKSIGGVPPTKEDPAGRDFSQQFTNHYEQVCSEHPLLKRLKVMFDLVCIAEGIANLGDDRPALDYLLNKYQVTTISTPAKYPLIHRLGEFHGKDGNLTLAQISGGLSLEAILLALEDGDVSGLKMAVLGTRPNERALCWDLPLDEWKMPNNDPPENGSLAKTRRLSPDLELPGFAVCARQFTLNPSGVRADTVEFHGRDIPAVAPSLPQTTPALQRLSRLRTSKTVLSITIDDPEIRNAILAEDWEEVIVLLRDVSTKSLDPLLRFAKAHACLATNRNNESVGLFSVATLGDLDMWERWCRRTAVEHANNHLASYFLGDMCARFVDYSMAIEHFTRAIEQDENSYLALDARGTVYVVLGEYDKALADLLKAKAIKPTFADVYNTLAMINMRQKKGLIANSKKNFLAVLEVNPELALAYHGLGCLELLESKDMAIPEDNRNIQKALELLPGALELLTANETRYAGAVIDKQAEALYANAGSEGTALKREYKLQQLADNYVRYEQQRTNPSAGMLQRMGAAWRSDSTQLQLANEARNMSQGDMTRLTLTDSYTSGIVLNAAANRVRHMDVQRRAGTVIHEAFYNVNSLMAREPIVGRTAARYLDRWNDNVYSRFQQRYQGAVAVRDMAVRAQDNYINQHLTNGTFDGRTYRMQNPYRTSGISEYTPSQSPAGYADRLNVTHGIPGNRDSINRAGVSNQPGGATMDKALITWNQGEWPFEPVFGLLYQVPQAVTDNEPSTGKGEAR